MDGHSHAGLAGPRRGAKGDAMTEERLLEGLEGMDAACLYELVHWLDGRSEDGADSDHRYFSRLLSGSGTGTTYSSAEDFLAGALVPDADESVPPIADLERCRESAPWLAGLARRLRATEESGLAKLRANRAFLLLLLQLLASYTYWGLLFDEVQFVEWELLRPGVEGENDYFLMNLAEAIGVNGVNIIRGRPEELDLELALAAAVSENAMLAESGLELLYTLARLCPERFKLAGPKIRESLASSRAAGLGRKPSAGAISEAQAMRTRAPALRKRAQGGNLANVSFLRGRTLGEPGAQALENPGLMLGLIGLAATDKVERYALFLEDVLAQVDS